MNAGKQVLRYLQATKKYQLFFPRDNEQEVLSGQADASWCSTSDGKGFSSYIIKLWGSVVAWKTLKQNLTALSSAEAELMAVVQCLKEIMWVRGFLVELGLSVIVRYPIIIQTDSQAVIDCVESLGVSPRTKHYRRLVSFVKDEVDLGNVKLQHMSGKELTADLLTKIFPGTEFQKRINELGVC
jgi:ribonuclease HI